MAKKIDESTLKAYLEDAIRSANSYDDLELTDKRTKCIEYYKGIMRDVPHQPGKSGVVSRDLAVTVGWMLPGIMRIFTGSDRMCDFIPRAQKDEEYAQQASDYVNYKFMDESDGYNVMWNLIHDSLVYGDGIGKVWWDDTPEYETHTYTNLTEDDLAVLLSDPEVEVLAQTEGTIVAPDGMEVPVYDIKIQRVTKNGTLRFDAIPPEDFLMDKLYPTIEESRFQAHRDTVTKSDLLEMGFDKGTVEGMATDVLPHLDEDERMARDGWNHTHFQMQDDSVQTLQLYECYMKMDVDGDGIAETVRAYYAGHGGTGELLDWEVWESEVPFVAIKCEPVPHKFDSNGISDLTMDIQRIQTVLKRNLLDNTYSTNSPQAVIQEGSVLNRDSIISPKPNQPVIVKRGSEPPEWRVTPFIGDKILMSLQAMDNELERRTGVSRSTMGLDPDALQNVTATAVSEQKAAATSKAELYARNMADGFATMFMKGLKLLVKHQDRPEVIKLRGNWTPIDPRVWDSNMKCTVNTGLGTGSREKDVVVLQQTLALQVEQMDRFGAAGMTAQAMEMIPKVVRTSTKIAESAGLKNADDYFITVNPQTIQQMAQKAQESAQQPSPEEQKMQMEQQLAQAQMQLDMQKFQMEHQGKMAIEEKKIEQHVVREREQLNADVQTKTLEAQLNAEFQNKELTARREKEVNDYEIELANVALKDREVAVKEFTAGMSAEQQQINSLLQAEMNEDKLDLEYQKLNAQKANGSTEQ